MADVVAQLAQLLADAGERERANVARIASLEAQLLEFQGKAEQRREADRRRKSGGIPAEIRRIPQAPPGWADEHLRNSSGIPAETVQNSSGIPAENGWKAAALVGGLGGAGSVGEPAAPQHTPSVPPVQTPDMMAEAERAKLRERALVRVFACRALFDAVEQGLGESSIDPDTLPAFWSFIPTAREAEKLLKFLVERPEPTKLVAGTLARLYQMGKRELWRSDFEETIANVGQEPAFRSL